MQPEKFLENFSTHLKNVIARAISLAASLAHGEVGALHVLLALAEESGSVAGEILYRVKLEAKTVLQALEQKPRVRLAPPRAGGAITSTLPNLNKTIKQALERAMLLAYERAHNYVGTEHLLFGLIKHADPELNQILDACRIKPATIIDEIETILQSTSRFPDISEVHETMEQLRHLVEGTACLPPPVASPSAKAKPVKSAPTVLDLFATELTDANRAERTDPVIGRGQEIERLINILCRRTKNNPVLIGEPGVGKTAIVEGLAKRIATGEVPDVLKHKKILALDLTLLIAGTIYRGEFEGRLKQIIDEVANNHNAILFIDELHNIIGAGSNSGTMDAANILKPALARGELRCIGATTIDEYNKYIMPDPALERRFQPIQVSEPSLAESQTILQGIKKYYEEFHHTIITAEAIHAAVHFSQRYIHDNFLPDKAIDLIDEAAAAVRAQRKATPLEQKQDGLRRELDRCRRDKETAIHEERFAAAIKLKKREEALEHKLGLLAKQQLQARLPARKKVGREEVARIISRRLDIPLAYLLADEWERLADLPERLSRHIIGQESVIQQVTQALRQSHLGLRSEHKPFASFLFAGPSGVGKTELAKALARELYHDARALVRLDMSEFAESHGVSKLLGSPAGYIGHKERNYFTDELRRRPYVVALFDEFDKAHPDVQKLLLQILDTGELTDSRGKKINFRHAIIILTSNVGAELYKSSGIGFGRPGAHGLNQDTRRQIISRLKEEFGAALIGRVQTIGCFAPLTTAHLQEIIKKQLQSLNDQLQKSQRLTIAPDERVITALARRAYSDDTGAREVESVIQQAVHDLIVQTLQKTRRKKQYTLTVAADKYKLM